MKYRFLLPCLLLPGSFYAFVLGDAGYLVRRNLEKEKRVLLVDLEDLQREEELLGARYQLFLDSKRTEKGQDPILETENLEKISPPLRITVLKFEDIPGSHLHSSEGIQIGNGMGITEIRMLFFVLCLFLSIPALYYLRRTGRVQNE